MIEKKYRVRPSWKGQRGEQGKEITLPPDWCRYNKIETGDHMKMLANGIVVILPPNTSVTKEKKVRAFLEGGM